MRLGGCHFHNSVAMEALDDHFTPPGLGGDVVHHVAGELL